MNFLKQSLILCLHVISITAFSQYSGQGPVTLTAPTGVTNIQWFNNTTGTPVAISGANNATYTTSTPGVYCVQFNQTSIGSCTASSRSVSTVIMSQGSSITLNGATNNSGATSYQWKNGGTIISGANTANLTVSQGGLYSLEIVNSRCAIQSESIYVFVLSAAVSADLSPTTDIGSLEFAASAQRDFVVNIFETNNSSGTTTPPLSFRVSKLSAFDITYSTSSGTSNVFTAIANSNSDWDFTDGTSFITATAKANVIMPPGGSKQIGFRAIRKTGIATNTNQNITVTVINGSLGEVRIDNNIVQTTITAN